MIRLYHTTNNNEYPITVYYDTDNMPFIEASLGTTTAVLFRQVGFTDSGAILFYGKTYKASDIEIVEGDPPPRVWKYT